MRSGCIGPLLSQAHFLKVCGFRFIEAAAGAVGSTSGRSVFIAINLRGEVRLRRIACWGALMARIIIERLSSSASVPLSPNLGE